MTRLAVLSYHTSPLSQPGTGDGGGMNVYVRELSTGLARLGYDVDVYTRREHPGQPDAEFVEPGLTVRHVTAGPVRPLSRDELTEYVGEFTDGVAAHFRCVGLPTAIHANYWLSGLAGHRLKHELNVPLIMTFHTLERVKATEFQPESDERGFQEAAIIACADAILASCDVEAEQFISLYNAEPSRVHVVPLGVEHAFFSPGDQAQARAALGYDPSTTLLLFVGRIQALKGVDVALETALELRARGRRVEMAIVGGPSGPEGAAIVDALHQRVAAAEAHDVVSFVAPQTHQRLSTWLRAADTVLVPSRSESFGLIALEAAACGVAVVASDVGGLQTLINHGETGLLLESREPSTWADAVESLIDSPSRVAMSNAAVLNARRYTWRRAASSLAQLVETFRSDALVRC